MSFVRLVRFFDLNEPDAPEQLSFPVLERAVSRSVGNYALGMSCARAAANSYPPASEPCAWAVILSASEAVRASSCSLCAREATSDSRLCVAVSVFTKQPRLFSAPPSRPAQNAARTKRSLTSKRYGLAKIARKTVVEILFRKVFLKFYFTKF